MYHERVGYLIGGALAPFFWLIILAVALAIVRRFVPSAERILFANFLGKLPLGRKALAVIGLGIVILGWLWIAVHMAR